MSPINESQQNAPKNSTMAPPADLENNHAAPVNPPRWQKEDYQVILRGLGLVTSLISFIVMARNNHGYTIYGDFEYSNNFRDYNTYRYLLSAAIISSVYNISQLLRRFCNGKPMFTQQGLTFMNFFGDQIVSYLLVSAASSTVQTTINLKNSGVVLKSFTDSSSASLSMAFVAFLTMALSAIISALNLSSN